MKPEVIDTVDKLLDTIRYEIDRLKDMGEDTTLLETKLRDFRKRQGELLDYMYKHDETSIKLFLTELLDFSHSTHRFYISAKEGKQHVDKIKEEGEKEIINAKNETDKAVNETFDLITNDDYFLDSQFGDTDKLNNIAASKTNGDGADSNVPDDKNVVNTDNQLVKLAEDLIKREKSFIDSLRKKGMDTLDLEFKISKQESLLVSMKEALVDGDYDTAQKLKSEIDEMGRSIL